MNIRLANPSDIEIIHQLAHKIWQSTYRNIISAEQIDFMLDKMYSHSSLKAQFDESLAFLIAEDENKIPCGFASFSFDQQQSICKIHKLYILPEAQGKGVGNSLINHIKEDAIAKGGRFLELNVNRNNPAYSFYKHCGFEVAAEVDIPYYQFTLNDYVMRMPL